VSITFIGSVLAAVLTLMVFSYLVGNNPLYRLAQHIFVGVSVGYAAMLLLGNVLVPQFFALGSQTGSIGWWLALIPLLLGVLLFLSRIRPPATPGRPGLLGFFGTIALNIALSTAAALAIGGALTGTLVPQVADSMRPLTGNPALLIGNLVVVLGVAASLYYFQFNVRPSGTRSGAGMVVATAGRWLIIIALGATLGTLTVSFVAALVDRVAFLFSFF
jgi:hypothetical protein